MRRRGRSTDRPPLTVLKCVLAGVLLATGVVRGAALPAPVPPAASSLAGAAAADGSFTVSIELDESLSGLNAGAAEAGWLCSARALSQPDADAAVAKVRSLEATRAFDAFESLLAYPAHYLKQQASVRFAVSGGAYRGRHTLTIAMARSGLLGDNLGHVLPHPAVLLGCWLQIYDAHGAGGFAVAPGAGAPSPALLGVPSTPYLIASTAMSGA